MSKIKYCLVIMLSILLFGCAHNSSVIYATNMEINNLSETYYVGDSINLSDIEINIDPLNATVKPKITSTNSNIVKVEENVISFIGLGECDLVFQININETEIKTITKTVKVINAPKFANQIYFNSKKITLNLDENKENKLNILPTDYSVTPEISYSVNNIVSYNYLTGIITPLHEGTTEVIATIKCDKNNVILAKFNCEVTNFIYATNINPTIVNSNNVSLETGYSGKIDLDVTPKNYNMGVTYKTSSNLLTINNDGSVHVGNLEGSGLINVIAKTKTGEISKVINFNIINVKPKLEVSLFYNNVETTKFYSGVTYVAKINTLNIDYKNVTFNACDYKYVNNNTFEIVFNNSGSVNFGASYTYNLTSGNKTINFNNNINVYNTITNINFGLWNAETEILLTNNVYNLYLINSNFVTEAYSNNMFNFANLVLSPVGINVCNSDLNIKVEGSAVLFNNNKITAVSSGSATITVTSSDPIGFNKKFNVKVSEVLVDEINVNYQDITLYLNTSNTFNLPYEVMPIYAYNSNVQINVSNNNVSYNNGVITANSVGKAIITLKCGNITKNINVTVLPEPNKMVVTLNEESVNNNDVINVFENFSGTISCELYFDNLKLSLKPKASLNGNSVSLNYNELTKAYNINAVKNGESTIIFSYNNLTFSFVVNVKTQNKIISAKFEDDNLIVNLFFTNVVTPNIILTLENSTIPSTDECVMQSSNKNIATIVNNNINLIAVGEVKINLLVNNEVCDTLNLTIINKEIIEINSIEKLKNLQDKSYLLTSDLDFSNFETIDSFNGEFDFNNHSINNLKVPLFNTLNSSAVIKNINFSNNINLTDSSNTNFYLIANTNHGKISNVSFSNLTVTVNNLTETSKAYLSLICNNNYGKIENINLTNLTINEVRDSATYTNSRCYGLTACNYGELLNISGNYNINNFVKVSGVADLNAGTISNVNLVINIVTPKNFNGAGLVYTLQSTEETTANLSDVNLEISLSGNVNINGFGGIIKNLNSEANLVNITSKVNILDSYPIEKLALFCYLVNYNNNITNCKYYDVNGYNYVIEGELSGLTKIEKA